MLKGSFKHVVATAVAWAIGFALLGGAAQAVELVIWSFRGQEIPEPVLRAFEAANPGVVVNQIFPSGDLRGENFLVASAAGVPPDLIHLNEDFLPMYVENNLVVPITRRVEAGEFGPLDAYFPGVIRRYQGEIYFVPHRQSVNTLLYNRVMFSEAGLNADEPPATWDEFRTAARRLTTADDGRTQWLGAVVATSATTMTSWFQPMLWQSGGDIFIDGRVSINNDAGREALSFFVDAVSEGYAGTSTSLFTQGRAGMRWPGHPGAVIQFRRDQGLDFVDVGPVLANKQPAGYGSLAGWVVPRGPNAELAIKLLAFTLQPEHVTAFLAATAFLPVRRDIALDYFGREHVEWAQKFVAQQPYVRFDILHPEARALQGIIAQTLMTAVTGNVPVETALEEAERLANAHLAERRY